MAAARLCPGRAVPAPLGSRDIVGFRYLDGLAPSPVRCCFACLVWAIVFAPPLRLPFSLTNCAWAALFLLGLLSALARTGHVEFALLEWSMWLARITLVAMMRQWPVMNRDSLDRSVLVSVLIGGVAYVAWFLSCLMPSAILLRRVSFSWPRRCLFRGSRTSESSVTTSRSCCFCCLQRFID